MASWLAGQGVWPGQAGGLLGLPHRPPVGRALCACSRWGSPLCDTSSHQQLCLPQPCWDAAMRTRGMKGGGMCCVAGLVRALGADVAELPILAVAPQLRGNGLARTLLAQLESALLAAGVQLLVMHGIPYYGSRLQHADAPRVRGCAVDACMCRLTGACCSGACSAEGVSMLHAVLGRACRLQAGKAARAGGRVSAAPAAIPRGAAACEAAGCRLHRQGRRMSCRMPA